MAQMMSIQSKIWKRLITNQAPISKAMLLLPPPKPHFRSPNFCTETAVPSTTRPDRGVGTEFLLNKCSLTEKDILKIFKGSNRFLRLKSVQTCEEVLELLNGCGLTTPAQIRKVTLRNPSVFFSSSERNIKPKLSFFRTFMKEEDICKLIYTDASFITHSEDRLKSAVSFLRKLGFDDEALSKLLVREPCFLTYSEKHVMESFKQAEDVGMEKGSKMFPYLLRAILVVGKEKIDRRLLCLSNLGFSEKQILDILKRCPLVLGISEEKVNRNMDFLVTSVGLPLDDFVKYPLMFGCSLEKKIIPRYRVVEALKSMQLLKKKISFAVVCSLTEKKFLERYIHSKAESSSVLLDIYNRGKVDIDKETH